MTLTRIAVTAGEPRAHLALEVGALAPRLVSRSARRARVAVAAAGMVLLGGDHLVVRVEVGAGCTLEIEDVGGTVAYPGAPSSWSLEARIGSGGTLLWQGLPLIVTEGADLERRCSLVLGPGARAVMRETVVLGRHGEVGGRVVSTFSATDDDGPVLVDALTADGHAPEPGVLGPCRVVDAVIALGFRPLLRPLDLDLDRPGAIARHLSDHTHGSPLDAVWDDWSRSSMSELPLSEHSTVPEGRPVDLPH